VAKKIVKYLLLVEVSVNEGWDFDYEGIAEILRYHLTDTFHAGNSYVQWYVKSAKEAIAP
jgi:hypothetical protein